jgi:hypothetical protein
MTPQDRKAFVEVVIGFAELKGKQLSAPAIELYWRAMQGWTLEEFRTAAEHLIRTMEFFPVPADFERLKKAGKYTAAEAWDAVLQHCKGAYRDGSGIDNGGPVDLAVRGLGGYRAIAFHDIEKLHFLERQFAERFAELEDVMEIRHAVPQLVDQHMRAQIRHDGPRHITAAVPAIRRPELTAEVESEPV